MITIPKNVKKKLKEYVGYKNVRVHFPNGEREDITNENIVYETLEIQESLCSKKNLEFGLCEATSLKFDCFGIENIKGATIDVTLEVYSDDGAMYSIPYGRYKVESCKRQEDINRRKVVAYDAIKSSTLDSYIGELINDEIQSTEPFRAPSIYQFEKNFFNEYGITQKARQRETVVWSEILSEEGDLYFDTGRIYVHAYMHDFTSKFDAEDYYTFLFQDDLQGERANEIKSYADTNNISFRNVNGFLNWLRDLCTLTIHEGDGEGQRITETVTDEFTNINSATLRVVSAVEIRRGTEDSHVVMQRFDFGYQDAQNSTGVYRLLLSDIEKRRITKTVAKTTARSLLSALYELRGTFGRINREDGYIEDVALGNGSIYPADTLYPADDLYPAGSQEAYRRGNYSSLSYEEYETKPFKAIYANYRDENGNDSEITYTFAEEGQTYNMTNNWILKNLFLTSAEVEEILVGMAERIKDITFVPFKMKAVGMPYLEAGDMIEISTEEGTIHSYILKRKISGIQLLEDTIEANGEE